VVRRKDQRVKASFVRGLELGVLVGRQQRPLDEPGDDRVADVVRNLPAQDAGAQLSRAADDRRRGDPRPLADYVLSDFAPEDTAETLVARAADAVEVLLAVGLDEAQRCFNERL